MNELTRVEKVLLTIVGFALGLFGIMAPVIYFAYNYIAEWVKWPQINYLSSVAVSFLIVVIRGLR